MMKPSHTTDSVDWLAQQYVLGELSEDEAARYEVRLADDVEACEAVAAASRLILSLQSLPLSRPRVVAAATEPSRVGRPWMAVAVSAACVLVLAIAWMPASPTTTGLQVRAEVVEVRELVDRWRGGRSYAGPLIAAEEDDDMTEGVDSAPSWMLAAVSIEKPPQRDPAQRDEVWEDN